jgi:hypothetical protein
LFILVQMTDHKSDAALVHRSLVLHGAGAFNTPDPEDARKRCAFFERYRQFCSDVVFIAADVREPQTMEFLHWLRAGAGLEAKVQD